MGLRWGTVALALALGWSGVASARVDSQVWTGGAINLKLGGKWRLNQEVIARFSDNRNGLYEVEATALVGYRLNKTVPSWPATFMIRNIPAATSRSWSTARVSR
jgi:hypothetical protein